MKLMSKLNKRSKKVHTNNMVIHRHGVDRGNMSSLTSVNYDKSNGFKEPATTDDNNNASNVSRNYSRQSSSNSSLKVPARNSLFETARMIDRDLSLAMAEVAAIESNHDDDYDVY